MSTCELAEQPAIEPRKDTPAGGGESTRAVPEFTVLWSEPAPWVPRTLLARSQFAAALRQHPGRWALLGRHFNAAGARKDAYEIRCGASRRQYNEPFGDGEFETQARTVCGEYRVYVRYIGQGGDVR